MGKKEDFEKEERQSLLVSMVAIIITLVIVAVAIVVVYFGFFRDEIEFQNSFAVSETSMEAPEAENILISKPVTEGEEEKPTGMGQSSDGEDASAESSGNVVFGEQDVTDTSEEQGVTGITDKQEPDTKGTAGEIAEVLLTATPAPINVETGHNFTEVNEAVTAKEATNLRNMPSQGEESKVKLTLYNGQVATRIGISDSGWSKVRYGGEIYYAVSSYLTTDLTPPTPVPEDDGIKTVFTERDEMVAPKIEVNLRTLPSVTNPESVVVVKLPYGTQVRRTGINTDVGWSRVEYEGQVLYCVSSYVFVVEQSAQ